MASETYLILMINWTSSYKTLFSTPYQPFDSLLATNTRYSTKVWIND